MYHLSHVFYSWTTKQSKEEGGSADASVVSAAARENHRFLGALDLEEMYYREWDPKWEYIIPRHPVIPIEQVLKKPSKYLLRLGF